MENSKVDTQTNAPEASYIISTHHPSTISTEVRNMIYAKFLRSLRYGNSYLKLVDKTAYFSNYHSYIELLLARQNMRLILATLSDDKDIHLGWALKEGSALHYVFVNPEQRMQGIAKTICGDFNTITHLTHVGTSIFSKLKNVTFNPWG